jgi:hypothetical protein
MGQKSVIVIICVNNHSKEGIISRLEQFCRFFVLKYLSEVYLTFPDIFTIKIQILLFFYLRNPSFLTYVSIVNHETTEIT